MMRTLPPAEDADELAADLRPIHFSIDIEPALYRRLLAKHYQCQLRGERVSKRDIIRALLDLHLPPDPHAEAC